jgi:hypothetical protein
LNIGVIKSSHHFGVPPAVAANPKNLAVSVLRVGKGCSGLFGITPSTGVGTGYSEVRSDIIDIEKITAKLIHFAAEVGQSAGRSSHRSH